MEISTDLVHALHQLAASAGLDHTLLPEALHDFTTQAGRAVASYQGLRLGLVDHDHEIVLTAFTPNADASTLRTTLRVPLDGWAANSPDENSPDEHSPDENGPDENSPGAGHQLPGGAGTRLVSSLVLYASTPGAFVDLAADLAHVLHLPLHTVSTDGRPADLTPRDESRPSAAHQADHAVVLDRDPLPTTTTSGLDGLEDRATIERAVGLLLDRGHTIDGAHAVLQQHATGLGVMIGAAARAVLDDHDDQTSDNPDDVT